MSKNTVQVIVDLKESFSELAWWKKNNPETVLTKGLITAEVHEALCAVPGMLKAISPDLMAHIRRGRDWNTLAAGDKMQGVLGSFRYNVASEITMQYIKGTTGDIQPPTFLEIRTLPIVVVGYR